MVLQWGGFDGSIFIRLDFRGPDILVPKTRGSDAKKNYMKVVKTHSTFCELESVDRKKKVTKIKSR